jgi:hypothetical protein
MHRLRISSTAPQAPMREVPARETDVDRQRAARCEAASAQEGGDEMTNQEGAVLDDFVDRAIENLLQGLASRMTYPEAKRAVRDGLLRGIKRMEVFADGIQPMDESGFSAGFGVGND